MPPIYWSTGIHFFISSESKAKLSKYMPHGTMKLVFNLIIEDLLELMEKHGSGIVIGAFINRDVQLKDLIKTKI